MKLLIHFILLFILSSVSFSQSLSGKERGDRASLLIRLANYTQDTARTLPVTLREDIKSFSELSLTEKTDLELVKNVIKVLIILDAPESEGGDPSRTSLLKLNRSYLQYSSIYDKAFKQLETAKNKKQLKEFRDILSGN